MRRRLDVKTRFFEEEIIGFLRETETGMPVKDLCRRHGFSEASYYLWRSNFRRVVRTRAVRIAKNDSDELGFVITCLFCSSITPDELHEWCFGAIARLEQDEIPPYVFALSEFNDKLANVFKVIGFVPSWKHMDGDEAALSGIAITRGVHVADWPTSREQCLAALANNSAIESRFSSTFSFIDY
jgi:hypothetical protein